MEGLAPDQGMPLWGAALMHACMCVCVCVCMCQPAELAVGVSRQGIARQSAAPGERIIKPTACEHTAHGVESTKPAHSRQRNTCKWPDEACPHFTVRSPALPETPESRSKGLSVHWHRSSLIGPVRRWWVAPLQATVVPTSERTKLEVRREKKGGGGGGGGAVGLT